MHVKKRNGDFQPVDLNKIVNSLKRYCELPNVDMYRIATKTVGGLVDGVSTLELDMLSVRTAKDLIIEDPIYSRVASRILANIIQKEVSGQDIQSFSQSIEVGLAQGLISQETHDLVMLNKRKLNAAIKHERDWSFEYHGLQTVYDRYLLKHPTRVSSENSGKKQRAVIETPQYFFMRVACGLAENANEAVELYNLLSSLEYMASTPTLFNSGTSHSQMSSCYLLDSPLDSLDDIYKRYADIAMLSKFAGGIGVSLSKIRGKGSLIKGTNGNSNGLTPWAHTLSASVAGVNQGGKRKGAACIYLETHHPDIMQFLELKDNTGEREQRAYNLNLANWISDLFMRRVKDDGLWSLFDPTVAPELNDLYGDAYEKRYIELEAKGKFVEQFPARKLYARMMRTLAETGNGWMCFKDTVNRRGNQVNDEAGTLIHLSNLCTEIVEVTSSGKRHNMTREEMLSTTAAEMIERNVHVVGFDTQKDAFEVVQGMETAVCLMEGTKVLTQEGYRKIEECDGLDVYVPYDTDISLNRQHAFEKATLIDNGELEVFELTLSGNASLTATKNHRFLVRQAHPERAKFVWKTVGDLQLGDELIRSLNDSIFSDVGYEEDFATLGWIIGDGWVTPNGVVGACFAPAETEAKNKVTGQLEKWHQAGPLGYGAVFDNAPACRQDRNGVWNWSSERKSLSVLFEGKYGVEPALANNKKIPDSVLNGSPTQKASFLSGLFSADGTVQIENDVSSTVELSSSSFDILQDVKYILEEFGVHTRMTWHYLKSRNRWQGSLRTGDKDSIANFLRFIGFRLSPEKQTRLMTIASRPHTFRKTVDKVLSVTSVGKRKVFDLHIPCGHNFVAEGYVTHNCNLGSINIGKGYVKHGKLDRDKLRKNVGIAVKFLDRVIDRNFYPIPESHASNMRWRPVGIGLMGLADFFFQLKMSFDSQEAIALSAEIQEEIYFQALKTSCELAKVHGAHRDFHLTRAAKGQLQFDLAGYTVSDQARWDALRTEIMEHGLRNSLLIAIAPTACQVGTNIVRTTDGPMSIYNILEKNDVPYAEIEAGGMPQWIPISPISVDTMFGPRLTNKMWFNGTQPTLKITYEDGSAYEYTKNHKLLVNRNGKQIWTEVGDLCDGDDIITK